MRQQKDFRAGNKVILFLAFFVSTFVVQGQTPTPMPEDETIRVNTDLIQTNVTVVDKNKRFVDGLKREQFELRVDGKIVPLEFFDFINSGQKATQNSSAPDASKQNTIETSPNLQSRKVIFFVDDLHLSADSLARTRSAVTYFIEKEMMPRDNVLIVSASGQIGFLQQFTDHKAVLRAALARLKPIPNVVRDTEPPPMPEFVALRIVNGDREAAEFYVDKILQGFNAKNVRGINRNAAYEMVRNRANNIVFGLISVSEATLGSVENLLEMLNQVNGRKLIFLASDGFYLGSKNGGVVDNVRLQRAVNMATRSGSTIYTIDARGLFSSSGIDASGERPVDPNGLLDRGKIGEDVLSQEGLFTLAEQTGGRFLKNQNYFDKWIDRTLDENANYYVLSWNPGADAPNDKKFKRIEVGVIGRPELTVRMQRGYLANWKKTDAKPKDNRQNKPELNNKTSDKIAAVKEVGDKKNLPVVLLLNYIDVPNVGGVLTSSVQVETGGLDYSTNQSAAIDVAGVILNDQGKQAADFKTGLNLASRPQDSEQNVIYNARTPLAPGIYQVKVGARESKSGHTGTATKWIEIPDLTKKQLALSDLLLGIKTLKTSDKAEDLQIQFSVDHQFSRPLQLDFMAFIYNAKPAANGTVNLATKIEIFDAQGRAIVATPMRTLLTKGIDDLARIPLTAAIKQQTSVPGNYLLRVTVNDLTAGTSVVQQTVFTVE